jgi:predicted Zn-dependent protease with MMP-like domain
MEHGKTVFLRESIQDLLSFLEQVPEGAYRFESRPGRSIGKHVRHCVNHLEALAEAMLASQRRRTESTAESIIVNYDTRVRDSRVETDKEFAQLRLRNLSSTFEALMATSADYPVKLRFVRQADPTVWDSVESTLGREIHYTVLHNTHHLALIREICERLGCEQAIPENSIKAKSTLLFELEPSKSH